VELLYFYSGRKRILKTLQGPREIENAVNYVEILKLPLSIIAASNVPVFPISSQNVGANRPTLPARLDLPSWNERSVFVDALGLCAGTHSVLELRPLLLSLTTCKSSCTLDAALDRDLEFSGRPPPIIITAEAAA
jgi:hypothetical protein